MGDEFAQSSGSVALLNVLGRHLPLFLFTLPAGALADLADRRRLLRILNGWLACSAGLMACCALLGGLTREVIPRRSLSTWNRFCLPGARSFSIDSGDRRQR